MGADVPDREIEAILGALGFAPERVGCESRQRRSFAAAWQCRQPSWRQDVTREVDLIEEVARITAWINFRRAFRRRSRPLCGSPTRRPRIGFASG